LHAVWFQLAMIVGDKATINQGAVVVHGHAGLGGAGVSVAGGSADERLHARQQQAYGPHRDA
jgi:hypothetical protein